MRYLLRERRWLQWRSLVLDAEREEDGSGAGKAKSRKGVTFKNKSGLLVESDEASSALAEDVRATASHTDVMQLHAQYGRLRNA